GADLYCANRIPEFRGFVARTIDSAALDPELCEQLTKLDRLVAKDITVPIPQGARCETASPPAFSTDEDGELSATFAVPCPIDETLAFYERWAKYDGWFIEHFNHGDAFGMMRLMSGTHCATFSWYKRSDYDMSLSIRLRQHSFRYSG